MAFGFSPFLIGFRYPICQPNSNVFFIKIILQYQNKNIVFCFPVCGIQK